MEVRRSELHSECVIELLHGDLSISVVVESSHEHVLFVVRHVDVHATNKFIQQQCQVICNARL